MDKDGYPTEEELEKIRKWDIIEQPIVDLVSYVESLWWAPDWGFKLSGKRILRLELHTGGWSGNENIIAALRKNWMFWSLCWLKSTRGGHYWFKIETILLTILLRGGDTDV